MRKGKLDVNKKLKMKWDILLGLIIFGLSLNYILLISNVKWHLVYINSDVNWCIGEKLLIGGIEYLVFFQISRLIQFVISSLNLIFIGIYSRLRGNYKRPLLTIYSITIPILIIYYLYGSVIGGCIT
ncbi:MAG: hypothetical protein ACFFDB_10970 [Promethearchaeota archaeon]